MEHGDLLNYRRIIRYPYVPGEGYNRAEPEVVWIKLAHPFRYRVDPVPHVHKYGNGHYYRRVSTTGEKRQWFDAIDQGVIPRRRRSPRMLRDTWDDLPVSTIGHHSWKCQKKRKQWM